MAKRRRTFAIRCPYCTGKTVCVDTRRYSSGNQTRRRRKCTKCEERFTTVELPVIEYNELINAWNRLLVLKDDLKRVSR